MNLNLSFVLVVLPTLLLAGCGLLRPGLDIDELTPAAPDAPLQGSDLPFVAPMQMGSWVVVTPSEVISQPTGAWVQGLGFAGLTKLVDEALASNPTLAQAQARLRQAEAQSSNAFSNLFPDFTLNASASRSRTAPGQQVPNSTADIDNRFGASVGGSYGLDIFGRVWTGLRVARNLEEGSRQQLAATRQQVRLAVVQTYIALLAATQAQEAWREAIAAAEEQNRLVQLRYAAGDIGVAQAQPVFANLQNLRVQALAVAQQRAELENALNTLLGRAPQPIDLPAADVARLNLPAVGGPSQVSATALLKRPDVQAAAAQLAASNANIGLARAAFLPSVNLQGTFGFSANETGNLFDWSQRTWAMGPVLTLPIFHGGALRANLKRSWAVYDEAVGVYRARVLAAYEQVQNALTAQSAAIATAQSARQAAAAMSRATQAEEARYRAGDAAKSDWLGSQILSAQARASAAQANAASHIAAASLFTALGE